MPRKHKPGAASSSEQPGLHVARREGSGEEALGDDEKQELLEAFEHIDQRLSKAKAVPGESENVVLGGGMPDRRLNIPDQRVQRRLLGLVAKQLGWDRPTPP